MVAPQWYISAFLNWPTNLGGANCMLAEILTPAARWHTEHSLLTYTVPPQLETALRCGQLVAIPYGDRVVEGIVWEILADEQASRLDDDLVVRPLQTILDPTPALLPHQRALAKWMAEYYASSFAHTALSMLPPGLMQRSQFVLRLTEEYAQT